MVNDNPWPFSRTIAFGRQPSASLRKVLRRGRSDRPARRDEFAVLFFHAARRSACASCERYRLASAEVSSDRRAGVESERRIVTASGRQSGHRRKLCAWRASAVSREQSSPRLNCHGFPLTILIVEIDRASAAAPSPWAGSSQKAGSVAGTCAPVASPVIMSNRPDSGSVVTGSCVGDIPVSCRRCATEHSSPRIPPFPPPTPPGPGDADPA